MNAKVLAALAALLLLAAQGFADEIHLKEGKILTGTITHESDEDYTIRLGKGMVLRVPKENAVKVIRSAPATPPASSTGYMTRPRPVDASKPVLDTSTATSTSAPTAPQVNNLKADTAMKDRAVQGLKISEITVTKLYPVKGATLDDIKNDITDRDNGKGIKVERKREASHAEWRVSWQIEGGMKTGVVVATLTVTMPQWKPVGTPSAQAIKDWNEFLASLNTLEVGRAKIYTEALDNFAESMAQLHSDSETDLKNEAKVLFDDMKTRAANRVQGYLRRAQNKK